MPRVLDFKQQLVGGFGQPVAGNPTPAMVEVALGSHLMARHLPRIRILPDESVMRAALEAVLAA
jgi:hypothetical protein